MGAHRRAARARRVWRRIAVAAPARVLAVTVAVSSAAIVVTACGGGGGPEQPLVVTSTAQSTPAVTVPDTPDAIVVAVIQACREKDAAKLRALFPTSISDEAIAAMLARGTDVQLLSQTQPDTSGDSVSIDVGLRILSESGESVVHRQWDLQRGADRAWRLTALPDCY